MKWWKVWPWRASHSRATRSPSTAGPYSIVSKISLTFISSDRVTVLCGVATGEVELEVALDIGEERARSESEEVGVEPRVTEFLLPQDQPRSEERRVG